MQSELDRTIQRLNERREKLSKSNEGLFGKDNLSVLSKWTEGLTGARSAVPQGPSTASQIENLDSKIAQYNIAKENQALKERLTSLKSGNVKPQKVTESQGKVATFAKRMEQAENSFNELQDKGYDRSDLMAGLGTMLPLMARSSESQRQDQAERNFINATLRRESGAAISPSEFENAELQYFPRTGDSPEVIAQKAQNRRIVMEGFKREAGAGYENVKDIDSSSLGRDNMALNMSAIDAELARRGL